MSKRKDARRIVAVVEALPSNDRKRNWSWMISVAGVIALLAVGVFAKNEWFPATDKLTGKRTGWFGSYSPPVLGGVAAASADGVVRSNGSSSLPSPTPQLSKEYVYAGGGSRLLAVVDANAQEAPPADLAIWRPSTGGWWVMGGQWSQSITATWGTTHDKPVEGISNFEVRRSGGQEITAWVRRTKK